MGYGYTSYDLKKAAYNKIKKAWNKFKPTRRKYKKQLTKLCKTYEPYDYGYMLNIMFSMIDYIYVWYSNKDLLYLDPDNFLNNYYSALKDLTRCKEIADEIRDNILTKETEVKLLNEFFTLVGKSCIYWWD